VTQLVSVPLESGGTIIVESSQRIGPVTRGGRGEDAITTGTRTLEGALGSIAPAAQSIIERLREAAAPETISLEFGLSVNASSGMIIASSSIDANIKISLTWQRDPPG
jgi:cysteine sulfinate desulfinase/cysteine desulfurase-like protein